DAILFVAEVRALEPQGSILEIGVARPLQCLDGAIDCTAVVQGTLGEPTIEADAEFGEVLEDVGDDAVQRQPQYAFERRVPDEGPRTADDGVDVNFLLP